MTLHNYHIFVDSHGDHDFCPNLRQDIELSNSGQSDKSAGVTHHIQGVFSSPRLNLRKVSKSFSSSIVAKGISASQDSTDPG